jgi:hypothetical protein
MFEKIAKKPSKKAKKSVNLEQTTAFLRAVVKAGCRLSYGAFAAAAKALKEDASTQIPAQRGAKLVKSLPEGLQPFVCRKAGTYAAGISWSVETPSDLGDRPVIISESVAQAIKEWKASLN